MGFSHCSFLSLKRGYHVGGNIYDSDQNGQDKTTEGASADLGAYTTCCMARSGGKNICTLPLSLVSKDCRFHKDIKKGRGQRIKQREAEYQAAICSEMRKLKCLEMLRSSWIDQYFHVKLMKLSPDILYGLPFAL
jgi:hypothetical protein